MDFQSIALPTELLSHNMKMAVRTGLEPATSCVTGRHSNQLNYRTNFFRDSENKDQCFAIAK
ncbi:hypothetical protein BACI349Y_280011 [Bacillus sp. 349Y]|nr:hypothetical protein BACI349Y_280011 [Bacillus sp. 349Y]